MDLFVKEKLTSWNLERLIDIFEENEVDEEAFKCLTPQMIKDLIPKAGPQAEFNKLWSAEFQTVHTVTSLKPNIKDFLDESSDFQCLQDVLCNVRQVSDFTDITPTLPNLVQSDIPNNSHIQTSLANSLISTLEPVVLLEDSARSSPAACTGSASIDSPSSSIRSNIISDATDIDAILCQTPEGIAVVRNYGQRKQLSPHNRLQLAGTIIAAELKGSTEFKVTSERLQSLAALIQKRFPTEKPETYYVPYRLDKITNKKILAKGKLYDKYVSYRTLLRRNGAIDSNPTLKRKNIERSRPLFLAFREQLNQSSSGNNEDLRDKLQWLKNCIEPWPTVEDYWKVTSKLRIDELSASPDCSFLEYSIIYRGLKQPLGYTLLSLDFSQIYPEKTLALYSEWNKFQKEILSYGQQRKGNDRHVKDLVALIPTLANNDTQVIDEANINISPEIPASIALRMLPLLLPCTTIKVSKKRAWRPSKTEVQNGFLLHVPSISHLNTQLASRKEKLLAHGLRQQPLPVIVGESLLNCDECYVCIDDFKYKVHSSLDAVDTAFKSFYALQLNYPKEAELTWMTVQKRVYDITGECDRIIPSVSTFIADLTSL